MEFLKKYKIVISEEQDDLLKQIIGDKDKEEPEVIEPTEKEEETPPEEEKEEPTEEDETPEKTKKKEMETLEKYNKEIDRKLKLHANKIINSFMFYMQKRAKTVISDFHTYGLDSTIKSYLETYYIPELKDIDEQLFLTLNMAELVPRIADKLKVNYAKQNLSEYD